MIDIFPDRNIVDEINSNRGSSAEQKIQYRIMQALESIAESAAKIANPVVVLPPMKLTEPSPEPIRATAKVMEPLPISPVHDPLQQLERRRRRQESA